MAVRTNNSNYGLIKDGNDQTYDMYTTTNKTGSILILHAKPLEGYEFVGWYNYSSEFNPNNLITKSDTLTIIHDNKDHRIVAYFKKIKISEVEYVGFASDASLYNGATSIYISRSAFNVNGEYCEDITLVDGITCVWFNNDTGKEVEECIDPSLDDPYIHAPAVVGNYAFIIRYTDSSNNQTDVCTIDNLIVTENYFKRITSNEELDYSGSMTHYAIVGEVNGNLYAMHFPTGGDIKAIPIDADEDGIIALGDEYSYIFRLYHYNDAVRYYPRNSRELNDKLYDFRLGSGPYKRGTLDISDMEDGSPDGDSGIMFRFSGEGDVQISQPNYTSGGNQVFIRLVYDDTLQDYVFTSMNTSKDTRESFPVYVYKEYVKSSETETNTYEVMSSLDKIYDGNPIVIDAYKDLLINGGETDFSEVEGKIRITFSDGKNEIVATPNKGVIEGPTDPGIYKFIIEETDDGKYYNMVFEMEIVIYDENAGTIYQVTKELSKEYDGLPVEINVYKDLTINFGQVSFKEIESNVRFVWRSKGFEFVGVVEDDVVYGLTDQGEYTLDIEEINDKDFIVVYSLPFAIYEKSEKLSYEVTAKLDKPYDEMPIIFNAFTDLLINDGKVLFEECEDRIRFVWRSKGYEEIGKPSKGIVYGPTDPGEYELVIQETSDYGMNYDDVYSIMFSITSPTTYTIVWKNGDTILLTEKLEYNDMPSYKGDLPVKESDNNFTYTFSKWDPEIESVTGDAVYTAVFTSETRYFSIKWKNYDGTTLLEDSLTYGLLPEYSGDTPVRADDELYGYNFTGWSPDIVVVSSDAEYFANYESYNLPPKSIEFGMYPQTKVTDNALIQALNTLAGNLPTEISNNSWTDYGYYKNDEIDNYMWYKDVAHSDGNIYRGVYFIEYRDKYTYGSSQTNDYMQEENGYELNTVYWFKFEPINWKVLSYDMNTKKAFVVSSIILDSQQYYYTSNAREIDNKTIHASNYKESDIRHYLNNAFYNTAFSLAEKELIFTTKVDNGQTSSVLIIEEEYLCEDTYDKLFLLSTADMTNVEYGFLSKLGYVDTARFWSNSDYAISQGLQTFKNNNYRGNWYLRTSSGTTVGVSECCAKGNIDTAYAEYDTSKGLVPAMVVYYND